MSVLPTLQPKSVSLIADILSSLPLLHTLSSGVCVRARVCARAHFAQEATQPNVCANPELSVYKEQLKHLAVTTFPHAWGLVGNAAERVRDATCPHPGEASRF